MNRWKENLGTKKRTGDGAARWARRIFCAFLIVIGCLVLADGVGDAVRRAENRDSQSEGNVEQNLSGKSDSDASEPIWQPDFAVLKCQNADVIAWIRIPGTHIDEPIVQTSDNESYRSIGLDGKPDPAGTVFLDCESAPDASDFHSIFWASYEGRKPVFRAGPPERRRFLPEASDGLPLFPRWEKADTPSDCSAHCGQSGGTA